jgi:hypothetical protein
MLSRTKFGDWGSELSEQDFLAAVAAVNFSRAVVYPSYRSQDESSYIEDKFRAKMAPQSPLLSANLLSEESSRWQQQYPDQARDLMRLWSDIEVGKFGLFRLSISSNWYSGSRTSAWESMQFLIERMPYAISYSITASPLHHEFGWSWPVRIGFLSDSTSHQLRDMVLAIPQTRTWMLPLMEIYDLGARNSCDLLFIPGELSEAEAMLAAGNSVRASAVIVLGNSELSASEAGVILQRIMEQTQSAAVGLARLAMGQYESWYIELVRELSHNQPLDAALFLAAKSSHVLAPQPLLIANPDFLDETRLGRQVEKVGRFLASSIAGSDLIRVNGRLPDSWHLSRTDKGEFYAGELGRFLTSNTDSLAYDQESETATILPDILQQVSQLPLATNLEEKNRTQQYLQTQVMAMPVQENEQDRNREQDQSWRSMDLRLRREESYSRTLDYNEPNDFFLSGRTHQVLVAVGPPDPYWLQGQNYFPEIPELKAGEILLDVVLFEPQCMAKPIMTQLTVRPDGVRGISSYLQLLVPSHAETLEISIMVLHRNRIIQIGKMTGPVYNSIQQARDASPEEPRITLNVQSINDDLESLRGRTQYGASLVLSEKNGKLSAVWATGNNASLHAIPALTLEKQFLQDCLSNYESLFALNATDSVSLDKTYAQFAMVGTLIYKAVRDGREETEPFLTADHIQVVATEPEAWLPIEYAYDGIPVDPDAKLCPNAATAMEALKCQPGCCDLKPEKYVCPLGFWGTRKIIERQMVGYEQVPEAYNGLRPVNPSEFRQALYLNSTTLVGASSKVGKADRTMLNRAKKLSGSRPLELIQDWQKWTEQVQAKEASVLLLLPHLETSGVLPSLELGKGKYVMSNQFDHKHIRHLREEKMAPIVLLLGCETGNANVKFSYFVKACRWEGAAIVVATGSSISGRNAVLIAETILSELRAPTSVQKTFGEVMRNVRRILLSQNCPAVMTLQVFGDNDWIIR